MRASLLIFSSLALSAYATTGPYDPNDQDKFPAVNRIVDFYMNKVFPQYIDADNVTLSSTTASAATSRAVTTAPASASASATITLSVSSASETSTAAASTSSAAADLSARQACTPYWMETIQHQGRAAFNANPATYQVFRNVKDFGAKGDGVTDDTAAINSAISDGGRCAPGTCASSSTQPAVVYFPAGTYVVSSSIIDYYNTQLIGNPNCPPTLKAIGTNFQGFGVIDGDQYQSNGLGWDPRNVFLRQIRNFVIDTTAVPYTFAMTGIHWPTAQATSLQNIQFIMPSTLGTQHTGLFIEDGSGGYANYLTFRGGLIGMNVGSQQFTMRNIAFFDSVTAINQLWSWGWTYKSLRIQNCSVGLNMNSTLPTGNQAVGSIVLIDSDFRDTKVGIATARNTTSTPDTGGTLVLENIRLSNVPVAVQGWGPVTDLVGTAGTMTITAWGQGHRYNPAGPGTFKGAINPNTRPASLISGTNGDYFQMSKPQYETTASTGFVSVRTVGATGDGVTDDTTALQQAINRAKSSGKILYIDHGTYKVTNTIAFPAGLRVVGEAYPVIMSSGANFQDINNPRPVIKVGNAGVVGRIEWSDTIISTQGRQPGATLIEFNLASSGTPSGIWDVHTRIGGWKGSNQQVAQCAATPGTVAPPVNPNCTVAFMSMHVTKSASNLYMENTWFWTADHDFDDPSLRQVSVYSGRGLYVESTNGRIWLVGTAVEHHSKYQYQFANTKEVFLGFAQTETPYYQSNPNGLRPFPTVASLNDPTFSEAGGSTSSTAGNAIGIRFLNSPNCFTYGAGYYSFFNNYSTSCSAAGAGAVCQPNMIVLDLASHPNTMYGLNTVGATNMMNRNGNLIMAHSANLGVFQDSVALFRQL